MTTEKGKTQKKFQNGKYLYARWTDRESFVMENILLRFILFYFSINVKSYLV